MSRIRNAVVAGLSFAAALLLSLSVQAQSGDVVVTTNTTWPTATYSLSSLTVQSGATLTVGGGSTVTVANGIAVTGNSSIVLQSINNTGKVNGAYVGAGVTLQAGTVQVDAGSSINADAQGYLSSAGVAESGNASGSSGGSYGGLGGYQPGPIYGSASAPVDLGSGGARSQYYGGTGGGAVRLIVSGVLTNNGIISANGEGTSPCNCGGGGAGGSVYVTTAGLAGSGSFTANGGSNTVPQSNGSGAGGGGRVAVYYAGPTTFSGFTASTASGGFYTGTQSGYAGSDGTAVFVDTSTPNGNVTVYASGFQLPANSNVQYNSLTIANHASVSFSSGSTVSVVTALSVGGGASLAVGGGSTVTVGSIAVTGNSSIVLQSMNNTGKVNGAYAGVGVTLQAGSVQVDAGSSINADAQGYLSSARRAEDGGAYGGSGGSYGGLGGYQPGPIYGSASAPVDLGSGGASAQYYGSNGGGALRLIVSGLLTNNGTISANGQPNIFCTYGGCGGGGAGGSVYVTTAALAGSGSFTATGGSNTIPTNNGSAAGGGGRVAVYYAGPTTFSGFTASTASGGVYTGTQTGYAGADGTSIFVDTSTPNGNATIYQHYDVPANITVQYNALTVGNGASLSLGGGSQVSVTQAMRVIGAITALATNNTAQVNTRWVGKGVVLTAGSLQIDATGTITADAQGYPQVTGPGAGGYTDGGSYGGIGGGQVASTLYGSVQSPVDLGSGGGGGQNTGGGAGGGALELLIAGTLLNNGTISANGGSISQSGYGGGGAGGSVFVQTHTLQGSGTISANGGSNLSPGAAGNGGGGGRISVSYLINSGVTRSSFSVNGGTGAIAGGTGTINFVQAAGLQWLQPSKAVVHGSAALQWTTNTGSVTTVTAAGPQTGTLATGGTGISNATWDTTAFPNGAYELRLTASDSSGVLGSVSKYVVVNNSVQWVSGTLSVNTHWTADHVYALEGSLIITSGVTLTIDAGTVIKSLDNFQILVQSGGVLTSLGTTAAPVIFTTFDDPTAGGNTSFGTGVPQPGDWGGVNVDAGGTFNSTVSTFVRYGQGVVGNTLTTDTTLLSSQAYEISGTLTVANGVTLTVQPGAVLKFDAGAGIRVNAGGTLVANGTLAQPIYFTSINDQSVGANLILNANPSATLTPPAAGDWNSIHVEGTASFNFVHMLYGGGPIPTVNQEGMLESAGNATITLANSTLAYSYYIGIQTGLSNAADTYTITNTTFFNNQERAINVYPGSTVHVVNCTFDGNAAGPFNHGGTMDIENSVITGFFNTQFGGVGGPLGTFVNNDVWTSVQGVPNYTSGSGDQTGVNGNISANPVYMNGTQHDYRPTYGSPLIDAANGTVANYPATDAYNAPRYNAPLVAVKKGTADPSGKYPDIGALEFVQSAPSNLDLTPSAVRGPSAAVVGTQVKVNWTVTNMGSGTAYGPWHDAVYLVRDPSTNPVEIYAGEVLSGQNVVLGPGAVYTGTGTVTVPGTVVGPHVWEVRTNVRGEVFEGINTANNKAVSLNRVQVDVPALSTSGGTLSGSFAGVGQAAYYKLVATSSAQPTRVQLALTAPATGSVQLFVGAGYVPTPQHYDYTQTEFNSATASVVIPAGSAQTFYIAAYPQTLSITPAPFTIGAASVSFSLTGVSPNRVVATGDATLTFVGGGFTGSTVFQLVSAAGGTVYPAKSVFLSDPGTAQVTFGVSQIPSGQYTATAIDGGTVTLANAVSITQNTQVSNLSVGGTLQTFLRVPQAFRVGFPSLVTLEYTNISGSDLVAPMVSIASQMTLAEIAPQCDGCSVNLTGQYGNAYTAGLVMATNPAGPAGILPAGASGSISFLATAPNLQTGTDFEISTETLDPISSGYVSDCTLFPDGTPPINCAYRVKTTGAYATSADFCASLTPTGASLAGYTRACMVLFNKAGFSTVTSTAPVSAFNYASLTPVTTGNLSFAGFNKVLAAGATALSIAGNREYDVSRLLAYEFQNDGAQDFTVRYHQGAFGYGTSHEYDFTLTFPNGTPVVTGPDGMSRQFATPSPNTANTYLGSVGDYGTIAMQTDGTWLLTEPNGELYHFLSSASGSLLDTIQDPKGNLLQLTYTGALVTSVADALGNTVSFQYDANGHIVSKTDAVGRVTRYGYETLADTQKSTFLTSVSDLSGTVSIRWNEGGPHGVGYIDDSCIATYCEPAIGITSIAYPDGTHTNFTYDAAGRLTGSSRDNGAEALTYTYNSDGSVTTTDGLGGATTTAAGADGHPISIVDPLGGSNRVRYDVEGKVVGVVGPLGDASTFGYDTAGNATSTTSPDGSSLASAFGMNALLTSLTDPLGSNYGFTYGSAANLTGQIDPSNQKVTYTYDGQGRALTRTNRRGQTTTFTYNAAGLLASLTLSSGAQTTYLYDTHGNLQSVSTAAGTTQYSYDSADRLTGVTNPDGTSLTYAYNAGGQLLSLTDSTAFVSKYQYDTAGRLGKILDASGNNVVAYTYDAAGRLSTKTFGNRTSTSIQYDAGGNKTGVIHYSPTHTVLAEYDQTYDAAGEPVSATTPYGALSFGYDLGGQLTSATTPAGPIQYNYDAAGNRTSVVSNANSVSYLPNNLNQYASVNGTPYTYDADGNLLSDGTYRYTYNDLDQMLSATSASDTWTFTYEALGARLSSTHNGTTTRYLNDPSGFGNVVATFTGTGTLLSHYVYGLDLTSAVSSTGTASYYHFDAAGNTTQMTGTSGTVVNSYVYLPFGEKTALTAGVSNPFTYAGSSGALDEGTGLYLMRNRWYSPALGRFIQQDPTGLGSDTNLYRYALNSPVAFTDPLGTDFVKATTDSAPVHVFNFAAPPAQTFLETMSKGTKYSGAVSGFNNVTTLAGVTSTTISLGNNIKNGDKWGVIHDLGLETAAAIDAIPGLGKVPGVGKVLKVVAHNASTIDEVSLSAGKRFANWWYDPPSPFTNRLPTHRMPPHRPPPPRPCRTCLFKPGKKTRSKLQGSIDPNSKLTSGFGDQGYIPTDSPVTYTITFENLPTATLPAQKVVVTDALASNLDWSTVQLQQVNFNGVSLQIPDGTQTYRAQATVSTDPNPVAVNASLNPATGVLTWTMQSVNPTTGGTPANPLAGFLPPNDSSNAGTGSLVFTVQPKTGLSNGTAITNQASIVFDVNAAISTNTVTNTIDSSAVISGIAPLPATTLANPAHSLTVSWSGTDNGGSGIAWYDIYVSTDGGQYVQWLSGTADASAAYSAAYPGHAYSFVSLATNNVGTVQATPGAVQTTTVVLQTPAVSVTPVSLAVTSTQSLSVLVTVAGSGTPSGTVKLTGAAFQSTATALVGGKATIVIPAGALPLGMAALTATYTPDPVSALLFQSGSGTATVAIGSPVVAVQVGTAPAGLSFTVDGAAYTSSQTFSWSAGSTHTLATAPMQTANGVPQGFSAWSDGGALSHTVVAGSSVTSYTANFAPVPLPAITVTPGLLAFTANQETTSAAQTVQLANTGNGVLTVGAITISGSGAASFSETSNCGASLVPGASCSIAVTFAPAQTATFQATLAIASNASGTATVALTGTGTAAPTFTLAVTPPTQTVTRGGTATYQVSLTPQGGPFTGSIQLSATGLPSGATASFTPALVIPGSAAASSTLTVRLPAATSRVRLPRGSETAPVAAILGCLLVATRRRRRLMRGMVLAVLLFYAVSGISGCGSPRPSAASTSQITITASSGSQIQTAAVTLVVTP